MSMYDWRYYREREDDGPGYFFRLNMAKQAKRLDRATGEWVPSSWERFGDMLADGSAMLDRITEEEVPVIAGSGSVPPR